MRTTEPVTGVVRSFTAVRIASFASMRRMWRRA